MEIFKKINLFGNELRQADVQKVTSNITYHATSDLRLLVDDDNRIITLEYEGNEDGIKVEIFAFKACTITYAVDSSTTENFSMDANTSIQFIFYNGWKHNGIYSAVWN